MSSRRSRLTFINNVPPLFAFFKRTKKMPPIHLLQSNQSPSDRERILVEEFLERIDRDIEKVRDRGKGGRITKLDTEYASLHNIKHRYKALLHPLRYIPPELLELIFFFIVEQPTPIPTVAKVCQKWREVALTIPNLWTNIVFKRNLRNRNFPNEEKYMLLLDMQLKRRGRNHLHVFIEITSLKQITHPGIISILSLTNEWESATIKADYEVLHSLDRPEHRGQFASLRRLKLTSNSRGKINQSDRVNFPYLLFAIAPLLRQVSICGRFNYCDFIVPWWQLVIYADGEQYYDDTFSMDVLEILPSMGHIQELKLSWGARAQTHLPFKLVFYNLEVLHVQFWSRCHRGLIDNLILPNLRELKITGQHSDPTDSIISLITSSWQHSCMLQKLTMHHDSFYSAPLVELLLLTPYLRELEITLPQVTDLASLVVSQEHLLVPDLRVLRILADTVCGDGVAATIHQIGVSRLIACDNPTAPLAVCVAKLEELTIIFPTDEDRLNELKFLEEASGSSSGILTAPLPEQIHDFVRLYRKMDGPDYFYCAPTYLDEVLESLTQYTVKDIWYLNSSQVHVMLHRFLVKGRMWGLSYEKQTLVGQVCRTIIGKWEPFLLEDLPNRHWAPTGTSSATYISVDNQLRRVNPQSLLYGQTKDLLLFHHLTFRNWKLSY